MTPAIDTLPASQLLRKRKALVRELLQAENLLEVRIAVMGSSTTNELVDLLEVLLLQSGFRPAFHQGDYGRFYEDSVVAPAALVDFRPDVVVLHTSSGAIRNFPAPDAAEAQSDECVAAEFS